MSVTIGIPLGIWGDGYASFLSRWWEGIDSLEVQPDEIVIVTDQKNFRSVLQQSQGRPVWIVQEDHKDYAGYFNRAIELLQTDWIAMCNVDDYFLPGALNELQKADDEGCNLICDHLIHKDTNVVQSASWHPEQLDHSFTLMGCNPMTKHLWQASGGFPEGIRFVDWGLAIRMRETGLVRAFYASTKRIVYDVGYDRLTMSGASLDGESRSKGNAEIRALVESLRK